MASHWRACRNRLPCGRGSITSAIYRAARQQHTRRRPEVVHWRTSTRRKPEGWRVSKRSFRTLARRWRADRPVLPMCAITPATPAQFAQGWCNLRKVGLDTIETLRYTRLQISSNPSWFLVSGRGSGSSASSRFKKLKCSSNWLLRKCIRCKSSVRTQALHAACGR
jgi:hypothetical protein